jgi:hypothetical protein
LAKTHTANATSKKIFLLIIGSLILRGTKKVKNLKQEINICGGGEAA